MQKVQANRPNTTMEILNAHEYFIVLEKMEKRLQIVAHWKAPFVWKTLIISSLQCR